MSCKAQVEVGSGFTESSRPLESASPAAPAASTGGVVIAGTFPWRLLLILLGAWLLLGLATKRR